MENSVHEVGESSRNADMNDQVAEPIVVILDGSVLFHSVTHNLLCTAIRELFLDQAPLVEFYVTICTMNELDFISETYHLEDMAAALEYATTFHIWECDHSYKNFSSESCIKSVIGGIRNANRNYIATTSNPFVHQLRLNARSLLITATNNHFFFLPPFDIDQPEHDEQDLVMTEAEREVHHQRIHTRANLHGLYEIEVDGDGACQFRALSHQMHHTEDRHMEIREAIADQIYNFPDLYDIPVAPADRHFYLESLLIPTSWGDGATLQAASDLYAVRIQVLQSNTHESFFEVVPNEALQPLRFDRVIHLTYLQGEHYNSLFPEMRVQREMWGNRWNSHIWF